jgi:alpha-L-rhamnosidase
MRCLSRLLPLLCLLLASQASALGVANLTVEYQREPLGIDTVTPRFSWQLRSRLNDTVQVLYQVRVSVDRDFDDVTWDSGEVISGQSRFVEYGGPPLESRQRYYWQVRVADNHGNETDWSLASSWEMGLLARDDWQARWITYPWEENSTGANPGPRLRRDFKLDEEIESARLYISALGLYEAWINGQRVGDQLFTPGWTAYSQRVQYQVYDVTHLLRPGYNAIGVALGDGWYRGRLLWGDAAEPEQLPRNLWGDRLALLAELRVTYADGSVDTVASSRRWQAATGPIVYSDIYDGELYDATLEQPGWSQAHGGSGWRRAKRFRGETPALVASYGPPVRAVEKLRAAALERRPDGSVVVDFGQNLVGWVRLRAAGQRGDRVRLRHGEVLNPDGSLYTANLRSAQAAVEYVLDGSQRHYEPNFTFQGFRYVEVTGYPGELIAEDIEAVVIHSAMPRTGFFETSDPALNQLQSNIVWGQKGNFLDVPTDCPQRDERLGWTGDAQVFAPTASFNFDVAPFFRKWLVDLSLEQGDDGAVPNVVPNALAAGTLPGFDWQATLLGLAGMTTEQSAGWGDAATILPGVLYQRYGDRRFLEDQYDSMRRYADFLAAGAAARTWWWLKADNWLDDERRAREQYLYRGAFTFGDWLAPGCDVTGCVSMTFVNTVFLGHSAALVAAAADELGRAEDEQRYRELSERVKAAFTAEYLSQGRLTEDTQGAMTLALAYDMLPRDSRQGVADRLAQLVADNDNRLATGFLATPHLLPVLSRYGHFDTAMALLQQRAYPSWLYTVEQGATTLWERWNSIEPGGGFGNEGMNSFNHYAYGSVGDWMYRTLGGIQPLSPGYQLFRVAPQPGGDLDWVDASLETGYGRIRSAWEKTATGYRLKLQVPVNTTAQVKLPGEKPVLLGSGRYTLSW